MPWLHIVSVLYLAVMVSAFVYAAYQQVRNLLKMRQDSAEHRGYLAGLDEGAATHEKLARARRRWKRAEGARAR